MISGMINNEALKLRIFSPTAQLLKVASKLIFLAQPCMITAEPVRRRIIADTSVEYSTWQRDTEISNQRQL